MPRDSIGTVLVTGDDGEPLGFVDTDHIEAQGMTLAYRLAAVCQDKQVLREELERSARETSPEDYGLVLHRAIRCVLEDILSPAVIIAQQNGVDLLIAIREIGENLSQIFQPPDTGGDTTSS